jgi:hypothetical protein
MKPFSAVNRRNKIWEIDHLTGGNNSLDVNFISEYLNNNAINLDLTENIYRIFDWKYFITDLRGNTLTLVRPHKWQDPFENFLLNAVGRYKGMNVDLTGIRNKYYSQCWSLNSECDGLWRNYKTNKKGCAVKAKTTTKILFENIYDIHNPFHSLNYFIGKVQYVNDNSIVNVFKPKYNMSNFQSGLELSQNLLFKRKPFRYEQEVRLIVRDDYCQADIIQLSINPNIIFEELILDPWIKPSTFKRKKRELEQAGFTGKITRSSLYDKPFFIFKIK